MKKHLNDEIEERSLKNVLTVRQLVNYLKDNFNADDKVCYMDCVEGVKNDCMYIHKRDLGKRFFSYVKKYRMNFEYVDENDIVIL